MSGVRIPPPRPTSFGFATEEGVSLRVRAAGSLLALLDGGCSSPGRAPDCGSGGSGFETRQPPHISFFSHGSLSGHVELGCPSSTDDWSFTVARAQPVKANRADQVVMVFERFRVHSIRQAHSHRSHKSSAKSPQIGSQIKVPRGTY